MREELLRRLIFSPKGCHACGTPNYLAESHCRECGERIRNRNPVVRATVTLLAVAFVGGVVWWKLKM